MSSAKQKLEWMRLDSATSINEEGGPFHRLLIQCTTEGVAVDFKVGMKVEDVISALRSTADRLEHRVADEPTASRHELYNGESAWQFHQQCDCDRCSAVYADIKRAQSQTDRREG